MHSIPYPIYPVFGRGGEDKVGDNLGIGGGIEGITLVGEFLIQVLGIDDITVMGYGYGIGTLAHHNGLGVSYAAGTPGGVAVMTDGKITAQLAYGILGKRLGYQPHPGINLELLAVGSGNAGTLLAAMLKSK